MNIQIKNMKTKNDTSISLTGAVLLTAFIFTSVEAAPLTVTNTFADGDVLTAGELNTNFGEVETAVNDNDTNITNLFGGDGSAGDLDVIAVENWLSAPPANPYFANITIAAGQTLTVPAGTTIRCSGSFVNNGTLLVATGARGNGTNWSAASPQSSGPRASAHPGDSFASATAGLFHDNSIVENVTLNAGTGGSAIPEAVARTSFSNFRIGGGAGGGGFPGGSGGGLVKIYCNGDIFNNSLIAADGAAGGDSTGGGGGGIVVIASRSLVDNTTGSISVVGGNGGPDGVNFGAGGGGGGGIVVMMSPTAPVLGTVDVSGGFGAAGGSTQTNKGRFGGGGGGASGGNGGVGGSVSSTGLNASGSDGGAGYSVEITGDPLFMAR
jgi:hypothetical protein